MSFRGSAVPARDPRKKIFKPRSSATTKIVDGPSFSYEGAAKATWQNLLALMYHLFAFVDLHLEQS